MLKEQRRKLIFFAKRSRFRKIWNKFVQIMACIVVFCTTYALILPAITMEKDYICGREEHVHAESCYTQETITGMTCSFEEPVAHIHDGHCLDSAGEMLCRLEELENHIHADVCYIVPETVPEGEEVIPELICTVPELAVHHHSVECISSTTREVLQCGLEEHWHTEECQSDRSWTELIQTPAEETEASDEGTQTPSEETQTLSEEDPSQTETVSVEEPPVLADGDVSAAAELTYTFKTVSPNELQEGVDYVVYTRSGNTYTFLTSLNKGLGNIQLTDTQNGTSPYTVGKTWSLTGTQMGSKTMPEFTWRVEKSGSDYYLNSQEPGSIGLEFNHDGAWSGNSLIYNTNINGAGCRMATSLSWGITGYLRYNNGWTGTAYGTRAATMYFAEVSVGESPEEPSDPTTQPTTEPTTAPTTEPTTESTTEPTQPDTSYPNYPNYPHAVHTGNVHINRLRFYNICEGRGGVSALAGCKFEIKGIDNGYSKIITSSNAPEILLPSDIPDGKYTITEISTPEGYMRDTRYTREFWIDDGMLESEHNIGTFINHNLDQLEHSKSGEVEDYNNRIYQILLQAESDIKLYEMEPIDVLFVVDRSNSMLFPSGMNEVPGKTLTLALNGTDNVSRNRAVLDSLDKRKVHFIIADPGGSATAWAIWYNGSNWLCQDASYYAKAKHDNAAGYQTPGELAIFPIYDNYSNQPTTQNGQKARANGAGLDKDLSGSSLGKDIDKEWNDTKTYQLYTAVDEFNRLHYLEESLANMIYALADANPMNRVTVVPFTKTVETSISYNGRTISMPAELTTSNAELLVDYVTHIDTSGGTRQDLALEYTYNTYLQGNKSPKPADHTYTILITDGAPVESDDKTLDQIYADIRSYGTSVKRESTLISVGLGLTSVEGGKKVLQDIASPGFYYGELSNASQLITTMQKILFQGFQPGNRINMQADIEDEISDSFYPIAWVSRGAAQYTNRTLLCQDSSRDWILLQEGDWITLDGRYTTNSSEQAGQLQRKDDGTFFIRWENVSISAQGGWDGTFYVKAKEDFIGGNAIDSNKSATLHAKAVDDFHPEASISFETPTVNVHLLDMNEFRSEETVYLGDSISAPLDVLRQYCTDTRVEKLISGSGDVLNKVSAAEGLEDGVFSLKYAMGRDLTQEEWTTLVTGGTVTVPYTYDDASSHGAVGYFTFRLEKTGDGAAYGDHAAIQACQPMGDPLTEDCGAPAETYRLSIAYTAYGLGDARRPESNVNNGSGSPGTEVGTGDTLATGLGTVEKNNLHEVHVISGAVRITKQFEAGLTDPQDHTFSFILHRQEDGEDTTNDQTRTITIPAGSETGSASVVFGPLKRGTYTVKEAADDVYAVKEITVLDQTNCFSDPAIGSSAKTVTFAMGDNVAGEDVIGLEDADDRYRSYIDPVNGVFGEARFTNAPIVYEGEVPVTKVWDDGTENHSYDEVYVVLYEDGQPLLDAQGHARLLRLNAANNWQGAFTVVLRDKDDTVTDHDFSVREVTQISYSTAYQGKWQSAILINEDAVVYYAEALEADRLITVGSYGYIVQYAPGENGAWTVTNMKSVRLPETGGTGTHLYTFSGLLMIIMGMLMYGYSQRRRYGRGANH